MTNVRHSSMPKACQSDRLLETIVAPRYPWCPGLVTLQKKKHFISSTIDRVNDLTHPKKGETGRVIHDRLFYFPKEEFYSLLHSTEFMWWKECCEGGREQLSPSFKGHKKRKTFLEKRQTGAYEGSKCSGYKDFLERATAGLYWIIFPWLPKKRTYARG